VNALAEPGNTAVLLLILGALLGVSALASRATGLLGVPFALLFIAVGIVAGREGLGRAPLLSDAFAFRVGTAALVFILFDGGLNTPLVTLRRSLAPSSVLATLGVLGTAALTGLAAHLFGFGWPQAFLLGAIVSATDAATVFALLRHSGVRLRQRVAGTLELESALNDPTAAILTVGLSVAIGAHHLSGWTLAGEASLQIAVGLAVGLGFGWLGRELLRRYPLPAGGLYPVASVALAFLSFGAATLLSGSGLLAVYVAAVLVGNEAVRYRTGLTRVHDALAWLSQVSVFLLLGLMVTPRSLVAVAGPGLAIAAFLTLVARPAVVAVCLAPFRYPWRETLYIGLVGLRGAVPVIFALFPALAGVPDAARLFHMVFFLVVANALLPGSLVRWLTRALGLVSRGPPPPAAALEITSTQLLEGELLSFYIAPASAAAGAAIAELPFPESAFAALVVRGQKLVAPKGPTRLEPGDHVFVFCQREDVPLVRLLFGEPGTEG